MAVIRSAAGPQIERFVSRARAKEGERTSGRADEPRARDDPTREKPKESWASGTSSWFLPFIKPALEEISLDSP